MHVKKARSGEKVEKRLGRNLAVLTNVQEDKLAAIVKDIEARLFGLTLQVLRKLVATYCERNKIYCSFT